MPNFLLTCLHLLRGSTNDMKSQGFYLLPKGCLVLDIGFAHLIFPTPFGSGIWVGNWGSGKIPEPLYVMKFPNHFSRPPIPDPNSRGGECQMCKANEWSRGMAHLVRPKWRNMSVVLLLVGDLKVRTWSTLFLSSTYIYILQPSYSKVKLNDGTGLNSTFQFTSARKRCLIA